MTTKPSRPGSRPGRAAPAGAMKLYVVHVRHMAGPGYVVAAKTPLAAAKYLVRSYAKHNMLAGRHNKLTVVYVCEHVWDGKPGVKVAVDSAGDKRYDVVWRREEKRWVTTYSEKSYA